MGDVVVVGGGVAGLGAAIELAGRGHRVRVIERDDVSLPQSPDDAFFHWPRRGAPQVHHSHAFLALLRNLLRDHHPALLASLLDAGATELRFTENLPETIEDRSPMPGDDDLVALACRRTTFEWVLRRHALDAGGVELVQGGVSGPRVRRGDTGDVPHVGGVVLESGEELQADLVVDASGRRSPLPSWLAAHDVVLDEREEDTGIVYSSRFYRLLPGNQVPEVARPAAADLGYLKYAVFIGDNGTFSITYGVPTGDKELRGLLREPGFDAACRTIETLVPWVARDLAEPITGVEVMAGLLNRRRTFVTDDVPVVTGVLAVGDAHTCTNPLYGRGCSLGFLSAHLAAIAFDAGGAADETVLSYDRSMQEQVRPWYVAAVAQDRRSRAAIGDTASGRRDTGVEDGALGGAIPAEQMESLLREGLLPATRTDPVVFRAFLRAFNLLDPPEQLLRDADVMGRVLTVWQARGERPPEAPVGPTRDALVAAISTT